MIQKTIKTQILDTIAKDESEILKFTQELITIATVNPPGSFYKLAVDAIKNKLSKIGLTYEIIEVSNQTSSLDNKKFPRYCILAHFGTGKKTLYFHGHYDVVPALSEEQFHPFIKKGNLYGRGSSDMKGGLAAMIYAIKAIKSSNVELSGKIGLTIVPDEETGGLLGSKHLSDTGLLGKNGVGMLLPEPTSGVVWNANRGAITLRIRVKGKPAHVALQYRGSNAFENMLIVANALFDLKTEVESRKTDYNIHPTPARRSILMMGGQSAGGNNFNLVPGEFSFTIDRRINPEEDLKVEKQRLLAILEVLKRDGINLEIEILQEAESAGTSKDNPIAQALGNNIEAITGKYPKFEMCPGLLEIRFYAEKGVPAFAYGPGLLSVSHGPNEFVKIKDIYKCTAIYALTAIDILST